MGLITMLENHPLLIAAVVLLLALGYLIFVYNGLVALRQRCRQALSDIDVQLKQRRDLIPNLVETVKGYAAHERGTLDAVITARNAAGSAKGTAELAGAEAALSGAMGRLFALAEAYPDLKANQNFLSLQGELAAVEDKIAAARRFLNNTVSEYNASIEAFPALLFAGSAGFRQEAFFDVGEERPALQAAPSVSF